MTQKGLWNLTREKMLQDRALPKEEGDVIREYKCQHYTLFVVFTILMNLHIFLVEPFNSVHIFRDALSVPCCLPADHTTSVSLSLRFFQARTVLDCFSHVVIGKCNIWKRGNVSVVDGFSLMKYHEYLEWWNVSHLRSTMSISTRDESAGWFVSHSWSAAPDCIRHCASFHSHVIHVRLTLARH